MNHDLTLKLVRRFPVLYQDFYSPCRETCMCWGFDHGDGWFEIIWQLSLAIEDSLGYTRLQKASFLTKKALAKRWNNFIYWVSPVVYDVYKPVGSGTKEDPYRRILVTKAKARLPWVKRFSWRPYTGFAVTQVKEKFGTLRYYSLTMVFGDASSVFRDLTAAMRPIVAANDRISNFVNMAEELSSVTCEQCGHSGSLRSDGWLRTLCDKCAAERGT